MYGVNEYAGLLVQQAREEKGWSQQYLADEIDIDIRTLRKIEEGKSDLPFDTLNALIHVLDISPKVLFNAERTDVGIHMDKLYRQLMQLSLENIKLLTESALYIRKWKDKHEPQSEAADHLD